MTKRMAYGRALILAGKGALIGAGALGGYLCDQHEKGDID